MDFLNLMVLDQVNRHGAINDAMRQSTNSANANIADMKRREQENSHSMELNEERTRADEEKKKAIKLADSVNFYQRLLAKPMIEIAAHNKEFEKTFRIQQQNLSDWMLSQKAYKDLTYDLAYSLGMGEHETDRHFLNKVDSIVSGQNPNEKVVPGFEQYAKQSRDNLYQITNHKIAIQNGVARAVDANNPNDVKSILTAPKPKP